MGGDELASKLNEVFRPVGIGAFHGAVEVYGREWSYGWSDEGTGVFSSPPKRCPLHAYRESVCLGSTDMSRRDVAQLLRQLEWPGDEYNLIRHNCCHWCEEFCRHLDVEPPPAWLNNLAAEVAKLDDGVRDVATNAQLAVEVAKAAVRRRSEEVHEVHEKILNAVEAKAEEFREAAALLRDSVEAKADELKEQAEATWHELEQKLGISRIGSFLTGEDLTARPGSALGQETPLVDTASQETHSGGCSSTSRNPLMESFRQGLLPFRGFGSERPTGGCEDAGRDASPPREFTHPIHVSAV
uniref:PPPDE domain-containing protein n=1 Tax=Zooxanthella nutricula TaxID=1333877 RepID=A0A7S2VQH2_9DINO